MLTSQIKFLGLSFLPLLNWSIILEISVCFFSYSSASLELVVCFSSSSFNILLRWSSNSIPCNWNLSISFLIYKMIIRQWWHSVLTLKIKIFWSGAGRVWYSNLSISKVIKRKWCSHSTPLGPWPSCIIAHSGLLLNKGDYSIQFEDYG